MKLILTTIVLILIISTNSFAQILYGEKRVVFEKEKNVFVGFKSDSNTLRFTATENNLDSADLILQNHFQTILTKNKKYPILEDYYRQYVGVIIKGERCIFINASFRKMESFLEHTYRPKGGGEGYFGTIINFDKSSVVRFGFNATR